MFLPFFAGKKISAHH